MDQGTDHTFIFDQTSFDLKEQTAYFSFSLRSPDGEETEFTETLHWPTSFPSKTIALLDTTAGKETLSAYLKLLHITIGMNYWKLVCTPHIEGADGLSQSQQFYFKDLYTFGFGELFYKNKLNFESRIPFHPKEHTRHSSQPIIENPYPLIGIGGGKDSLVALEILRSKNIPHRGLVIETMGNTDMISTLFDQLDTEILHVEHTLDTKLFELNRTNKYFNGHVPFSARVAGIGSMSAWLYGHDTFFAANEHSASFGNLPYLGIEINHQWSKSFAFERNFQEYLCESVPNGAWYASLLRPFTEIRIAQLFSQYPQYFHHATSCNKAFTIQKENRSVKPWCCSCPKCAFVFALYAAFIPKQTVLSIFGENLFDKQSLLPLYQELLGKKDTKPFECVGTPDETMLAFALALRTGEYDGDFIAEYVKREYLPEFLMDDAVRSELQTMYESSMPLAYVSAVEDIHERNL